MAAPIPTDAGFGALVAARLDILARLSDDAAVLTRLYLSPAHRRAVDLVATWMRDAGMSVRISALGDVVGRYEGRGPRTLILGSHIDTVRDAGRFDGTLGVLTAIDVVRRLHESGRRLAFSIEVVAFGDEEGSRFPSTLTGSRALAGRFDPRVLDDRDGEGVTRRAALIAFGCDPDSIAGEARRVDDVLGYLEVHIEQGPVLQARNRPLGVVTAIAGASRGTIAVTGVAGHAGTVPMALRHDAVAAAAEITLAIEAIGRATDGLVATVGRFEVANAATNTVAGAVTVSIDVRSASDAVRLRAIDEIRRATGEIARSRRVDAQLEIHYEAPAAIADSTLVAALVQAIGETEPTLMTSGAGHDAMAFSGRIPFAMLFVRCRDGISHHPDELASPGDIDAATKALAAAVDALDSNG